MGAAYHDVVLSHGPYVRSYPGTRVGHHRIVDAMPQDDLVSGPGQIQGHLYGDVFAGLSCGINSDDPALSQWCAKRDDRDDGQ